jgi:cardiolipin synthase
VREYDDAMMHAKLACFDDGFAVVGTSNLDRQSFYHSWEVNLIVEDRDFAKRVSDAFDADFARARAVDLDVLARRSFLDKLRDRLAAILLRWI